MLGALSSVVLTVNFADRSMRTNSDLANIRYWRFLPGGSRVYAYDQGAWLLDLEAGKSIEICAKKTKVGGFVRVPGRSDRFMTGNEVGGGRIHY